MIEGKLQFLLSLLVAAAFIIPRWQTGVHQRSMICVCCMTFLTQLPCHSMLSNEPSVFRIKESVLLPNAKDVLAPTIVMVSSSMAEGLGRWDFSWLLIHNHPCLRVFQLVCKDCGRGCYCTETSQPPSCLKEPIRWYLV